MTAILATVAAAQSRADETEVRTFHLTSLPSSVAYQEIVTTLHKVVRVSQELPDDPVSGDQKQPGGSIDIRCPFA
jgi:hypothetical protein